MLKSRILIAILGISMFSGPTFSLDKHKDFIKNARASLAKNFKDPSSAQWRNSFVSLSKPDSPLRILCGEVNAKNSYGAYAGFRRFYTSENGGPFLSMIEGDEKKDLELFLLNWKDFCSNPIHVIPD